MNIKFYELKADVSNIKWITDSQTWPYIVYILLVSKIKFNRLQFKVDL